MFIHTHDRYLFIDTPAPVSKPAPNPIGRQVPKARHFYPLRIAARAFALIGAATAIYAAALIGLFLQSGILVL